MAVWASMMRCFAAGVFSRCAQTLPPVRTTGGVVAVISSAVTVVLARGGGRGGGGGSTPLSPGWCPRSPVTLHEHMTNALTLKHGSLSLTTMSPDDSSLLLLAQGSALLIPPNPCNASLVQVVHLSRLQSMQ